MIYQFVRVNSTRFSITCVSFSWGFEFLYVFVAAHTNNSVPVFILSNCCFYGWIYKSDKFLCSIFLHCPKVSRVRQWARKYFLCLSVSVFSIFSDFLCQFSHLSQFIIWLCCHFQEHSDVYLGSLRKSQSLILLKLKLFAWWLFIYSSNGN